MTQWDTSELTNIGSMFEEARSLISVDFSQWDDSKIEDISSLFKEDYNLEEVDFTGWTTRNLKKMNYAFEYTDRLKSIDMSGFTIVPSVTEVEDIFTDSGVSALYLPNHIDLSIAVTSNTTTGNPDDGFNYNPTLYF